MKGILLLWRIASDILPSKERLARIGIGLARIGIGSNEGCIACGENVESTTHTLLSCQFARAIWFFMSPELHNKLNKIQNPKEMILESLSRGSKEQDILVACIMDEIYRSRNKKIFKNVGLDPMLSINQIKQRL